MENIDALGTEVFDASSILIKLSGLVFWLEPDLLPCWPMDAMNWFMKLAAESPAGWLLEGPFALDAPVAVTGARP
jgi:hypothetical protein